MDTFQLIGDICQIITNIAICIHLLGAKVSPFTKTKKDDEIFLQKKDK